MKNADSAINRKEFFKCLDKVLIERAKLIYFKDSAENAVKAGGFPIRIDDVREAIIEYNKKFE